MVSRIAAAPQGFMHRFASPKGIRLHYVEGGNKNGPTIVLLAGFPENWLAWRKVMISLAPTFYVVAIDLPGQGDSDRPTYGYDTQTVAERVHDLVNHLGFKRYGLAAHDVGAWVAFPYSLLYGDEVGALVLMDAGIPGITLPDMLPSTSDKSWKTWHFGFHAVPDLPEILLEGRERAYLEWFFRTKTANPNCVGEEEIDEYLRIFLAPGGIRAGLSFYRSLALSANQNRTLLEHGGLKMPTLGLGADQGSIPDLAGAIRPFAARLEGEVIANCGHFQPEEQPDAVADALTGFFNKYLTN